MRWLVRPYGRTQLRKPRYHAERHVMANIAALLLDSTGTIITLTLTADSTGTVNDPGGPTITPPTKLAVSHVPVGGVMFPSVGFTVLLPRLIVLSLLGVVSVEAFLIKRRAKRR